MNRFRRGAVKEAFDNLPSGVCFFDQNGMVTLCNHQMHRLVFALTGRDLQSLFELRAFLEGDPPVRRENGVFLLDDGSAWRFSEETITTRYSRAYTQVVAARVTELYHRQKELEEEILNMKMRVHDDIGRSVIATRQFLQQNRPVSELDLTAWKNAVRLLRHDNEQLRDEDALARLTASAESIGIRIRLDGSLPEHSGAASVLTAAIRECMTNAVRHAGARELYVRLTCGSTEASAVITNDGVAPEGKITEGGGLSSLRVRVRKAGGTMKIQSTPRFELTVTVPVGLEETL